MKIYSFNVNGIRSVFDKGFLDWLEKEKPEIVCLQEIKADVNELDQTFTKIDGYYSYFNSAQKKGYAGTAVYTRIEPKEVESKIGLERFDDEGRSLKLVFDEFTLYNFYIPHGGRFKENMPYKLEVYEKLLSIFESEKDGNTILAGDFNIAHNDIDVFHAKQNYNNTMFTPEERNRLDRIIDLGYTDSFRDKNPEKQEFSWWPYRGDLRERNIGWRIDYLFPSKKIYPKVIDAFTRKDIPGSDHGPVGLELKSKMKTDKGPVYPKATLF